MNKKTFSGFLILSIVFLMVFAQAKTLQIDVSVQGLESIQDMELYYGYPIYYTIFTNYSVDFYGLNIYDYDVQEESAGSFKAQLFSPTNQVLYEKYFEPSFMILSDPPTETDFSIVSLGFPFSQDAKYLKVYYGEDEKLSIDISDIICNNNGICEESENFLSCSNDCSWFSEDGLCSGYNGDGYCDLDCYDDFDCHEENCNDGIKNQDETSIDSGGICMEGNCYDEIQNGDEQGIDCEGRCLEECFSEKEKIILDWLHDIENLETTLSKLKGLFS